LNRLVKRVVGVAGFEPATPPTIAARMPRMVHAIRFALFIAFMLAGGGAIAADESAAWDALRADGYVALIRHTSAPVRRATRPTTSSTIARPSAT
jgi:hypothetical protein